MRTRSDWAAWAAPRAVPLAAAGSLGCMYLPILIVAMVYGDWSHLGETGWVFWTAAASLLGAAAGGALLGPQFGLPGLQGLLRSLLAYIAALFAGSLIGGTLAVPGIGTLFGPGIVFTIPWFGHWLFVVPFAVIFTAMHFAGRWRYRRLPPDGPPPRRPLVKWLLATAIYAALLVGELLREAAA